MKDVMKIFKVDARTLLHLGRGSIKDHTTALVELIKNSYDADATIVQLEIMINTVEPYIRIADNGQGMTEDIVDEHWLRIGYSEKIASPISKKRRRRTGEKGIGRISADRLGSILELYTLAEGSKPFGLIIDWDSFDVKGKVIEDIPLTVIDEFNIQIPSNDNNQSYISGTELVIKNLRQTWSTSDLNTLAKELSILYSPLSKVNDFLIDIKTDIVDNYKFTNTSQINENFFIKLQIDYSDIDHTLTYTSEETISSEKKKRIYPGSISLENIISRSEDNRNLDFSFGPLSITLAFYLQRADIISGTGFSLTDLRLFLQNNAGISIYRDNIRVKPYGTPDASEWDWLNLGKRVAQNPAGAGRADVRIGPNQIVGAVFVSRDNNPKLIDSSAREGLIQGPAFFAMREIILASVNLLETRYHEVFTESRATNQPDIKPSEDVRQLGQELKLLQRDLRSVRQSVPASISREIDRTLDKVEVVTERIQETQRSLQELASQATIYRGLATIGISASIFSHETQLAISSLVGTINNTKEFLTLDTPNIKKALSSINRAIDAASRIAAWGAFALDRVQRDKRRRKKVNIKNLILDIVDYFKPLLNVVNIDFQYDELEDIDTRTFAMDIEAALVNLLTNAYTACQEKSDQRIIRIGSKKISENKKAGFEIVVSDSGPGVDPIFLERIWSPLFSTKTSKPDDENRQQSGTGLGLAIVDSVVKDLGGTRSITKDTELKGARFRLWFPIQ